MFIKELPVELTQEELNHKSKELVQKLQEQKSLNEEKAEAAKSYSSRLNILSDEIRYLADAIRQGTILKEIECDYISDYDAGVVKAIRLDTREVIDERIMREDEKQMDIEDRKNLFEDSE